MALHSDVGNSGSTDDDGDGQEKQVERDWVHVERGVGEFVQDALEEVDETSDGHDGTVDGTEGLEAKDLGAVVGDARVEEGSVCDEDEDVDDTGGKGVADDAEDTDEEGDAEKSSQDDGGREGVEEHADKWDGEDASEGQGDVEDPVKGIGGVVRAEQEGVLGVDSCDEVVQTEHLDGGEEADESEPPGAELERDRVAVEDSEDGVAELCLGLCCVLYLLLDVDGLVGVSERGSASGVGWWDQRGGGCGVVSKVVAAAACAVVKFAFHSRVDVLFLGGCNGEGSLFVGWVWDQLRRRGEVRLLRHHEELDDDDEERDDEVELVECL